MNVKTESVLRGIESGDNGNSQLCEDEREQKLLLKNNFKRRKKQPQKSAPARQTAENVS